MNPKLPGRPAITGKQTDRVWDFLRLSKTTNKKSFTDQPHLTLSISPDRVEAMVTIPNSINARMRRNLRDGGYEGFVQLTHQIVRKLAPVVKKNSGVVPYFKGVQRRYASQKSTPNVDAMIEFDLRTIGPKSDGGPKIQAEWLRAAYTAFANKRGSNYQFQMGTVIFTNQCKAIKTPAAINLIADSWIACKPLLNVSPAVRRT